MGTSGGSSAIGGGQATGVAVTTRFLASDTYTIPAGCTRLEWLAITPSNGAGSGARGAAAAVPCGGGGGGGGSKVIGSVSATGNFAPGTVVTVTVGSPGTGGAAVTADSTVGNAGTAAGVHQLS